MQIKSRHNAGKIYTEIINVLKVDKLIVYCVMTWFTELGTSENRPRSREVGDRNQFK